MKVFLSKGYVFMSELKCIIVDDDLVSQKIIEGLIARTEFLSLVKSFTNPIEASSFPAEK